MRMGTLGAIALALALSSCAGSAASNSETATARTGVVEGKFLPCPGSPNCVSSMASSGAGAIAPLEYGSQSREEALRRLLALLEADGDCRIVERRELQDGAFYVRAEYRSKLFRFVDDVEFLFPRESNRIHVKSASRLGYSDMGVNRKRIEDLRSRFIRG